MGSTLTDGLRKVGMYPSLSSDGSTGSELGTRITDEASTHHDNDGDSSMTLERNALYPQLKQVDDDSFEQRIKQHATIGLPLMPDRSTKGRAMDKHSQQLQQFHQAYNYCADRILSSSNYVKTPIGYTGLYNLGNTCFMNATLQALLHTPGFIDLFCGKKVAKHLNLLNNKDGRICGSFAALVDAAWSGEFSAIRPRCFLDAFADGVNADFADGRQHDAQEFQIYLLDALHEETNGVVEGTTFAQDYNGVRLVEDASDYIARSKAYSSSVVNDFFNMTSVSLMDCGLCRRSSVTFNSSNQISVELPLGVEVVRVQDCLKKHFGEELMHDVESWWRCSKCSKRQIAVRETKLWTLPPILVLHLKRFSFNGVGVVKNEVLVDLDCSAKLDMAGYMHRESQVENTLYSLFAVTNHRGGMDNGHYTSFVKNQADGNWLKFDDEQCSWVDRSAVVTSQAFVLYFVRNGHEWS